MYHVFAIVLTFLALSVAAVAAPAAAGPRIDGTFIQYTSRIMSWSRADWERELDLARRAGMTTIVVQWVEYNGQRFIAEGAGAVDPTESILGYADRHGMQVIVGLSADDDWWSEFASAAYLDRSAAACERVAGEVWQRYGKHASFAGWYLPNEAWDARFAAGDVERLRAFYRRVSDRCTALSGPKPVSTAPFFTGTTSPDEVRRNYAALLDGAGIDVLMVQDSVGARGWDADLEAKIAPYFAAFRDACLSAGVELWSDLESFRLVSTKPDTFAPTTADRIARQITVEAPFVKRFVTFEFFTYMSPTKGAETKAVYDAYVRRHVAEPFRPLVGRSVQVDPGFGYYADRSARSIAEEVRANGYGIVHFIVTNDEAINHELAVALRDEGIGAWYLTFANGTYSTASLPKEWPTWKMVTRTDLEGKPLNDGYTRFCLNNPAYRTWKKARMAQVLHDHPFAGVEFAEPHWPEYPGITSPAYGCFCAHCKAAFTAMFPEEKELPDILHADSPRHPTKNPALWAKWLKFRQATLTAFLNDLVNGPGGIRKASPHAKVCTWTLALTEANGVERVREVHGEDAADVARTVRPDVYMLQTHWPDWVRAELKPDYVDAYRPFIDPIHQAAPGLPILVQADTGSWKQNRRSWEWIHAFEDAAIRAGANGSTIYEYFIGDYMYTDPPRVAEVRRDGETLRLLFTKRLDPKTAGDASHYAVGKGKVESVTVDGSTVVLKVSGLGAGERVSLTVRDIADARDRRLFDDKPVCVLKEQKLKFVW